MNKVAFIVGFFIVINTSFLMAQPLFSTSGDWNTASNWTPAAVPSGATTAVEIKNNTDPTISTSGSPHVIGSVSALGTTHLTVNASSSLTLGSQANFDLAIFANMTLNNNSTLTVDGTLIIYGDLIVNNTLTLNITGTFIVYGSIIMNNNADIVVSGTGALTVDGSITGGTNTKISTSGNGTIAVAGDITIQTGSVTGTAGSISVGGTCTDAGALCVDAALPVELLFFSGNKENEAILLQWATATEENFNYFEIERATQGSSFEAIGEVKGSNSNSYTKLDYTFTDTNPEIGLNYYRLKSIDLDGTFEYSDVVLVKFASNLKLLISPNPSVGLISIKTNISTTEGLRYEITNQYGIIVHSGTLSGFNTEVDLQSLPKGVYIIHLVDLPSVKAQRFILK